MRARFIFFNFCYIINILSLSSYANQVTYLPNANNGQAQQQYYNPGNQNNNGIPQPFNQNGMIQDQNGNYNIQQPLFNNGQQIQPNNVPFNMPNNNPDGQQFPNRNYVNNNPINNQINNNMNSAPISQQQIPNQNYVMQNNTQNNGNVDYNNQLQQQVAQNNISSDSLVIMPENSDIYYVAAPDAIPMDMIKSDMKSNKSGFWLFVSRFGDLSPQMIEQIQNQNKIQQNNNQQQSNNTIQNSNSNNTVPTQNINNNNAQLPTLNTNNNAVSNSNIQNVSSNNEQNNNNNQVQNGQNDNQQSKMPIESKNVSVINSDSNNTTTTTIVDKNTPVILTPVKIDNGDIVCAITKANPKQIANTETKENLPTLNDSQQTNQNQ